MERHGPRDGPREHCLDGPRHRRIRFEAILATLAVQLAGAVVPDLRIASIAPNPGAGAVFRDKQPGAAR